MPTTLPVDPVSGALAAGQTVLGAIQAISGSNRAKNLLQQRRAYQTPEELFKALNLTSNLASQGYDPFTLSYLTNQTDQAFNSTLGASVRLGANPNDLSQLFNQKVNQVMKIGADNHALNMENVGKYLGALDQVASSKAAEQKSQQDIIKDELQAANEEKQSGLQNIFGGANTALSSYTNQKAMNLFTDKHDATLDYLKNLFARPTATPVSATDTGVRTVTTPAPNTSINYNAIAQLTPEQLQQFLSIFNRPQ